VGRGAIAGGTALINATTASAPIGPHQLQAAIAAVHDEAAHADDSDRMQILALYTLLGNIAPRPDGHSQPRRRSGDGARPAGSAKPRASQSLRTRRGGSLLGAVEYVSSVAPGSG